MLEAAAGLTGSGLPAPGADLFAFGVGTGAQGDDKDGERKDLAVDDDAGLKPKMDTNSNGSMTQAEAKTVLDRQDLTTGQKADLWNIINSSRKTNPYR